MKESVNKKRIFSQEFHPVSLFVLVFLLRLHENCMMLSCFFTKFIMKLNDFPTVAQSAMFFLLLFSL